MVRMSDILKKARESKSKEEKKEKKVSSELSEQPKKVASPPETKKPDMEETISKPEAIVPEKKEVPPKEEPVFEEKDEEEEKPRSSEVRISSVVMKGSKIISIEDSERLYENLLDFTKKTMEEKTDYSTINIEDITQEIEKLINQLSIGNDALIMLALTKDTLEPHYLFGHTVNSSILSIKLGLLLKYEKTKLIELGISALLHDIGMIKYLSIVNQPRKLTIREYDEIKKHSVEGSDIIEHFKGINKRIHRIVEQHHERMDGSGYPHNFTGNHINEFAKILSLVDVYEAMMHPRVYRNEYPSLDTMRELITHKQLFDYKILKILIDYIGILPVGSFIELNTKEIAQVVKINPRNPMRPVVKIIYDTEGKELSEEKLINLATQCNIYSKKCISIKRSK